MRRHVLSGFMARCHCGADGRVLVVACIARVQLAVVLRGLPRCPQLVGVGVGAIS